LREVTFRSSIEKRLAVHPAIGSSNDAIDHGAVPLIVIDGHRETLISANVFECIVSNKPKVTLAFGKTRL
jgi:hypothetical protein